MSKREVPTISNSCEITLRLDLIEKPTRKNANFENCLKLSKFQYNTLKEEGLTLESSYDDVLELVKEYVESQGCNLFQVGEGFIFGRRMDRPRINPDDSRETKSSSIIMINTNNFDKYKNLQLIFDKVQTKRDKNTRHQKHKSK